MPGNRFGNVFNVTTFGESHGVALGAVIDGVPPGFRIDKEKIQKALDRRRPGQSHLSSPRKEGDQIQILSGLNTDSVTLGTPVTLMVLNHDSRPRDYQDILEVFRPSHADYTTYKKFGIKQTSGGGRASARETLARVAAGAFAEQILSQVWPDFSVVAWVDSIHDLDASSKTPEKMTRDKVDKSIIRCPDPRVSRQAELLIAKVKSQGDSLGGSIYCYIQGVPEGLGDPVFDKLEADLAKAMMSIPATKAFAIGSGFAGGRMLGSEHNDCFLAKNKQVTTLTNHSGGVQGGISNGEPIYFRVGFKPPATIFKEQKTVNALGKNVSFKPKSGRHDPCVLPRAVPIVEAMSILVIMEHYLRQKILINQVQELNAKLRQKKARKAKKDIS